MELVKRAVIVLVVLMVAGGLAFGVSTSRDGNSGDTTQESVSAAPKGDPISINSVLSKDVYTFVCELPKQKRPELIYFTCADGNTGIGKIKWEKWEATGASGVGEYFANDCEPDCASGKFKFNKVKVAIDKPIGVKGKVHLTHLTYEATDSSKISGEWDLAEFYLMMEQDK